MTEKTNNHLPAVSIGMPVYNGEKYIREALDMLLAQTFTDFELVISDNCSKDSTSKICQEYAYKDSRIKYFRQDENVGANANFEFLLKQASGELFMWAACDDYLEKNNYLSEMVNTMQGRYDFCFPNVKFLIESAEGKTISNGIMGRFASCKSMYDYSRQTVFTCSYQVYGLFRRNFLIENFKYIDQCKHLRCYGEGLFVHAITANSLVAYVPAACLIYRRHGANISSTQQTSHLLIDLLKFTYMLSVFYLNHKKLTNIQKVIIIKNIIYLNLKHVLILVVSKLKNVSL